MHFPLLALAILPSCLGHLLPRSLQLDTPILPRSENSSQRQCKTSNGLDPANFSTPLYTESGRPQILFSPSSGFMNDPNGLVKSGDTWHLYYQYNPTANVAGNQHWGHATSKDLYTWDNHLPAIFPKEGEGIFSGSAILDVNNTSGFFNESIPDYLRFVAIYTLHTAVSETQHVAYSLDGGFSYIEFTGNPVLDLNTTQFRDPQVIFDERVSKWIMTVALPQTFEVVFYSSSDLKSWTEESRFGPAGLLGYQYECPNLFQVPMEGGDRDGQMGWMLLLSINPGMPLGGSAVQYFFGDFDGTTFTPVDAATRIADFGKDWYATQMFYNAPEGKAIGIGWASNWQYTNVVPTSPFRNSQSSPRELKLVWSEMTPLKWGYQLTMQPYNLESIEHQTLSETTESANQTVALTGDGAFQIRANFSITKEAMGTATNPSGEFVIYDTSKESFLKIGFTFGAPIVVYADRRFAGSNFADGNVFFTDRFSQQLAPNYRVVNDTSSDQLMEMRILVDRTVTEVFAQKGIASAVILTYCHDENKPSEIQVTVGDESIKLDNLLIEAINGTWPECP